MTHTAQTISPLRRRMIEDMRLRKLSPKTQTGFWLLSGEVEAIAVLGALSVLALFSYWSRIGRALKAPG